MAVATLGRVKADSTPRRIETGAAVLSAAQYTAFKAMAEPTDRELIEPGDVVMVEEFGDDGKDGALVMTIRSKARAGKCIALNGQLKGATIPVLAIARANYKGE